jgi:hypothetical protein
LLLAAAIAGSTVLASFSANAFFGPFNPFRGWGGGPWGWGGYPGLGYPGWGGFGYPGWGGYPAWGAYPYAAPAAPATKSAD